MRFHQDIGICDHFSSFLVCEEVIYCTLKDTYDRKWKISRNLVIWNICNVIM